MAILTNKDIHMLIMLRTLKISYTEASHVFEPKVIKHRYI